MGGVTSVIVSLFNCIYMQKGVSVHRLCQCIYVLSLVLGSDIVQWMIKNLDIEDQGKKKPKTSILISGRCLTKEVK